MEGQEDNFTPGDNFTHGGQLRLCGQSLPQDSKLRMDLSFSVFSLVCNFVPNLLRVVLVELNTRTTTVFKDCTCQKKFAKLQRCFLFESQLTVFLRCGFLK
jgi:hypothetical protein